MGPFTAGHLYSLLSGLFWAVAVILFKKSGEKVPPPVLNLFKGLVALLVFLPLFAAIRGGACGDFTPRDWLLIALSGFVGITLSDTLFFMALNRLGASMNAVVDCVYAPSMTLLAVVFLGERPTGWTLAGGGLILAAILVGGLSRPEPGRTRRDLVSGFLLGSAGMVLVAASVVFLKRLFTVENLIPITTVRLAAGTLLLLPPVLARTRDRECFFGLLRPSRQWRVAVPGSLLGAALAMLAWIAGFTLIDVTTASVLNQFSTIYIFLLAILVLGEPVTVRRVTAIALALLGALAVIVG